MNAEQTIQIVDVQTAKGEDASSDNLRGKLHLGIKTDQVVHDSRRIDDEEADEQSECPSADGDFGIHALRTHDDGDDKKRKQHTRHEGNTA